MWEGGYSPERLPPLFSLLESEISRYPGKGVIGGVMKADRAVMVLDGEAGVGSGLCGGSGFLFGREQGMRHLGARREEGTGRGVHIAEAAVFGDILR